VSGFKLDLSEGLVGRVIASQQSLVIGDIRTDPGYVEVVPGMASTVAVPLIHKAKPIGALNILSASRDIYTERDATILSQFASHVASALVNARLFERERQDADAFEMLAEIGRDVAAVLDLDELLARIAQLTKRIVDYRTFGILLYNEITRELEMESRRAGTAKRNDSDGGAGRGAGRLRRAPSRARLVPDVSKDPRYIKVVEDVRSELAIPMLLQDRCVGVFDLESPELDAFTKRDIEILTLLASQAAVAIENARLYEEVSKNEARLEKELGFAKRVQAALLPTQLPKRLKGVDVAGRVCPRRGNLGGDFHDFLMPDSHTLVVALGDVSGKGVPAALYSVFAGGELVRGRTFRRRFQPGAVVAGQRAGGRSTRSCTNASSRSTTARSVTPCSDMKRRTLTLANSGLPYPGAIDDGVDEPERTALASRRILHRRDVRRTVIPDAVGRRVRVLFGWCVGSDERAAPGVHVGTARRGRQNSTGCCRGPDRSAHRHWCCGASGRFPPNDDMTVVVVKMGELQTSRR
jgi:sigma-B regulation protein RsbU (phosphoserine phosphatase)